jgi:hypothetical protein
MSRVEIIMIAGPVALLVLVLEMVRRRRLREDYALVWLATAVALIVLALGRDSILVPLADMMGIYYHPMALFVIGMGFMLLILLQFSMVITKLAQESKEAAQHIALLGQRVNELEHQLKDER